MSFEKIGGDPVYSATFFTTSSELVKVRELHGFFNRATILGEGVRKVEGKKWSQLTLPKEKKLKFHENMCYYAVKSGQDLHKEFEVLNKLWDKIGGSQEGIQPRHSGFIVDENSGQIDLLTTLFKGNLEEVSVKDNHKMISQLMNGMKTLFKHHLIHLDITPKNILVDGQGNCYIADFQDARFLDDPNFTPLTSVAHTLLTTIPVEYEEFLNAKNSSLALKLGNQIMAFQLGVLLFHKLTGEYPYELDGLSLDLSKPNDSIALYRVNNITDDEIQLIETLIDPNPTKRLAPFFEKG